MVSFSGLFSELKRLLATSHSRPDHDTSPEPASRDPHMDRSGIFHPPPPQRQIPAYIPHPLHAVLHTTPLYPLGHPSSVSHSSLTSLTRPHAPTIQSPPTSPLQLHAYSPPGSNHDINVPPPAYISEDRLPTYSYSESVAGPASPRGWARRSRLGPVVGPIYGYPSDPSQNSYPVLGHAPPSRGHDIYRDTLFGRIMPARRNLWLPAIVVGAVIGVYVLVKVGGKDKDVNK